MVFLEVRVSFKRFRRADKVESSQVLAETTGNTWCQQAKRVRPVSPLSCTNLIFIKQFPRIP